MTKIVNKVNLGYLGTPYQYRLVSSFVNDPRFFVELINIIDQNMFTEVYLKKVVGIMKDYYNKHGLVPRYDMILLKLRETSNTEDDTQHCIETINMLKDQTTEGVEEIQDMAEKFFKQQNWVRVANEIRRIAGDGDISKFDDCQRLMEEAMSVGRKYDQGISPWENIDANLSEEDIVAIPTGISKLDDVLGGGLHKGDVGLIIAALGCGKTSITTSMAHAAAVAKCPANDFKGFKVLQIVFEDTVRQISRKYYSKVSQIETRLINRNSETTEEVRSIIKDYEDAELMLNNVKVLRLSTGEVTATDIKEKIKKMINEGFKPDLLVVDYFECLVGERGTGSDSEWVREGKTMRKFENMAKDLDMAIWIPSQGNRESTTADLVTVDKLGGSIKKAQIAQVVISVARTLEDTKNQKATLSVLKNRSGSAGVTFSGIKFDNGTCTISCDETIDFDNALSFDAYNEALKTNKEDEFKKEALKMIRAKQQVTSEPMYGVGGLPNDFNIK